MLVDVQPFDRTEEFFELVYLNFSEFDRRRSVYV
jgi:hypothetical protein